MTVVWRSCMSPTMLIYSSSWGVSFRLSVSQSIIIVNESLFCRACRNLLISKTPRFASSHSENTVMCYSIMHISWDHRSWRSTESLIE